MEYGNFGVRCTRGFFKCPYLADTARRIWEEKTGRTHLRYDHQVMDEAEAIRELYALVNMSEED